MLELLSILLFGWLFIKVLGLCFRIAWGGTKLIVSVLMAIAVPMLIGCLLFAGGLFLLIPVAIIGIAFGILKACV